MASTSGGSCADAADATRARADTEAPASQRATSHFVPLAYFLLGQSMHDDGDGPPEVTAIREFGPNEVSMRTAGAPPDVRARSNASTDHHPPMPARRHASAADPVRGGTSGDVPRSVSRHYTSTRPPACVSLMNCGKQVPRALPARNRAAFYSVTLEDERRRRRGPGRTGSPLCRSGHLHLEAGGRRARRAPPGEDRRAARLGHFDRHRLVGRSRLRGEANLVSA